MCPSPKNFLKPTSSKFKNSRKPHIVFIIGNYKNGGVARRATNLANEFAKFGYSCSLLVTREIADKVFFKLNNGVEIIKLDDYFDQHKHNHKVEKTFNRRQNKIRLLKKLRSFTKSLSKIDAKLKEKIHFLRRGEKMTCYAINNPDSLYIPFGISCFERVFSATFKIRCPIIYAERNAPEIDFPKDINKRLRYFKMLSTASGAVFQTHAELSFFNEYIKGGIVINNPVKANLPQPYIGERRKVVVNFCRIAKQKNIPLIVDAFIKLHEDFPDYTLEIYGNTVEVNEEQLLSEYKDMVKKYNADKFIKFLPPRADVHDVIKDAMMFVSSSDFEGLSNSMLEALAIGLPCVCTDCLGGGAREMITDGENGILVPMNDADALYAAMKRMITDDELRTKCSLNASKVKETHAVEKISEKWLKYIESVI